jgi:subtilisin family serine protease
MPAHTCNAKKILLALLPLFLLFAPARDALCGELSGSLHTLAAAGADEKIQVLVFFDAEGSAGISKVMPNTNSGRSQLHKLTYDNLRSASDIYQCKFENTLEKSGINAGIVKKYWITPAALVELNVSDLESLANLEGVSFVAPDTTLALVEPVSISQAPQSVSGAESNLRAIGADKLWARGLTGKGRLIGSFDTGVDGNHPALSASWYGNIISDNSAAWFDPYGSTFPMDMTGHGSHVMGIMVGRDGDDTIGVAFNANWICASVIDRGAGLSKTISDILSAFEWAADPDGNPATIDDVPDVICHSWGIPSGLFPECDSTFWSAIDNLEQLGVVCIFAAGNEGPDNMSLRTPADRCTSALNAFAVGAVDHLDPDYQVAAFSSRGPSRCDNSEIKPEVVAPGVYIRSAHLNSSYKYISGTSMAAPHVAAAVALLREYNPEATSYQIKQALYSSAMDLGDAGEDNDYGNGLIDLEAALALMPPPPSAQIEISDYVLSDDNDDVIEAGEQFDLVIEIFNHYSALDNLLGVAFMPEAYGQMISDSAYFGSIAADESATNQNNPYRIALNADLNPGGRLPVDINFYDYDGDFLLTKRIEIVVGQNHNAKLVTIENESVRLTVDNFGGFGHGINSPSPSGCIGFAAYNDVIDILPEFSLMIAGSQSGRVSDAARSESGFISDNDFMASRENEAALVNPGNYGSVDFYGYYNDSLSADPLGISISQRTSLFDQPELENCVIIEYTIGMNTAAYDDSLYIGLLMDWDLGPVGDGLEMYGYDPTADCAFIYNQSSDLFVGVRLLNTPVHSNHILPNPLGGKTPLSDSDKYDYLTSGTITKDIQKWADYFGIISTHTAAPDPNDFLKLGVAIVIGETLPELQQNLTAAYNHYNIVTGVEDETDDQVLPLDFTLDQNYPNPFNMATTISFSIPASGQVSLDVYNLLGQKVINLAEGEYPAGNVSINWDGRDRFGNDLASGMYFYRMSYNGDKVQTRKLMILK